MKEVCAWELLISACFNTRSPNTSQRIDSNQGLNEMLDQDSGMPKNILGQFHFIIAVGLPRPVESARSLLNHCYTTPVLQADQSDGMSDAELIRSTIRYICVIAFNEWPELQPLRYLLDYQLRHIVSGELPGLCFQA